MSRFWSETLKQTDPYTPGEQPKRSDIIKLNTNENPHPPSPKVITAIQAAAQQDLQRYPSPTVDRLRDSLADYYQLNKDHVFVGNGSDEVLAFSFMAFFDPGQPIRFPEISYSFYPVYARLFNVLYEKIPLNADFSLPVESFFNSEGGVVFPNPNAPTSIRLPLSDVKFILEHNPERVIIVDEAYIDFADEGSAVSLIPMYDNLLVVQTMSKSRSLAGLRVGYALGHPDLIEGLMRIKDSFNSYTLDRLAIAGAQAAIEDDDYFEETTQQIIDIREWFSKALTWRGFDVLTSQTNFVFVHHPDYQATTLFDHLKRHRILVRHFKQPGIEDYLRITIGLQSDMEQVLTVLDALLDPEDELEK